MSPLNRGPLLGPRMPPVGMRPMPPPRFGGRLPPPGMPPRLPPHPMNHMFGPMRQRMPLGGPGGPLPIFGPRVRGMPPMMMGPMMGPRGMGPRGPHMRPAPRGMLPPQGLTHMRARLPPCGVNMKGKGMNNSKKVRKLEELELKKPWMTDEIRSEIQKKNKLYAKAKKNKDAKEWEEFKDLRNKVTRMIRDAKTEYLAKNPDQVSLYPEDTSGYDERDESYNSSDNEREYYCEVCDREFPSEECLQRHKGEHRVCGIDGCVFSAHPKLVEKHISMQHSTGLYHRMKNLSTPEDIEKWIMERKKRYPTKANIEHQKAEASEKKKRYEIIREKKSLTDLKSSKIDQPRKNSSRRNKNRKRQFTASVATITTENELYKGVRAFPGTSCLREETSDGECSLIEDSDNEMDAKNTEESIAAIKIERGTVSDENKKLSLSLVADYGTDSDKDNDDEPEEIPFKKIKVEEIDNEEIIAEEISTSKDRGNNINRSRSRNNNNNNSRNRSKDFEKRKNINKKKENDEECKDERRRRGSSQRFQRNENENRNMRGKTQKRNKIQLLNKLLSRPIQHERNLIAQCIKYISDNNYFE